MPSPSSDATPAGGLDVYLLPAVIGGGLGDIAEVLDAGRVLSAAGFPTFLYRAPGRPLPPSVDGPWDWPPIRRVDRLTPSAPAALTLTPAWGVSAAPARSGPLGRPGPWATEAAEVESAYGTERTLHVSLEEFARTLTSREENLERYREGGVPRATARRRATNAEGQGDRATWAAAFRRYRALDQPNVLPLLATFERSAGFAREFPEIVQVGPLWPDVFRSPPPEPAPAAPPTVLWYASPGSSAVIAPELVRGLRALPGEVRFGVRSPRSLPLPPAANVVTELLSPLPTRLWRPRFAGATLRIVTGSRSLLEALELGGPFLYFNGVLGGSRRRRRHRPEKIVQLLRLFQRLAVPRELRRDLDAFSRAQRVREIVERALIDPQWRSGFPTPEAVRAALPEDLGRVLLRLAREFASRKVTSIELVGRTRATSAARGGNPRSKV